MSNWDGEFDAQDNIKEFVNILLTSRQDGYLKVQTDSLTKCIELLNKEDTPETVRKTFATVLGKDNKMPSRKGKEELGEGGQRIKFSEEVFQNYIDNIAKASKKDGVIANKEDLDREEVHHEQEYDSNEENSFGSNNKGKEEVSSSRARSKTYWQDKVGGKQSSNKGRGFEK